MIELEPDLCSRRFASWKPTACALAVELALTPVNVHARVSPLSVTAASAAEPSVASGPLRIEVADSIADAQVISGWIQESNPSLAEEIPSIEGHAQWIAVTISGATYDYLVSVTAIRDGEPLGVVEEPEVCQCNSEALLQLVDARIANELAALRAAPPPQDAVSDESHLDDASGQSSEGQAILNDSPRRLGPMSYAGIAVGVLAAGSLATGIALMLRPDEIRGEPGLIEIRSTRSAGIGLVVGGGAVLAAGISLLVVDLVRERQRIVTVGPVLSSQHFGISITWNARGRVRR